MNDKNLLDAFRDLFKPDTPRRKSSYSDYSTNSGNSDDSDDYRRGQSRRGGRNGRGSHNGRGGRNSPWQNRRGGRDGPGQNSRGGRDSPGQNSRGRRDSPDRNSRSEPRYNVWQERRLRHHLGNDREHDRSWSRIGRQSLRDHEGQYFRDWQDRRDGRNSYGGPNRRDGPDRWDRSSNRDGQDRSYRRNSHDGYRSDGYCSRGGHNSRNERNSRDGPNNREGELKRPREGMRMSKVNMPSGTNTKVTVPAKKCRCAKRNKNTRLIKLNPEGKMGKREFDIVSNEMNGTIKQHKLQDQGGGRFTKYEVVSVHKIVNCCAWKRFRNEQREIRRDAGFVNEKMLFHGSPAVDEIVKNGFDERRANQNGMFGAGVYFGEHSSKSNQYVYGLMGGTGCPAHKNKNCYTCERKMLLCRVTLGAVKELTDVDKRAHPPPDFHSVKGVPSPGKLQYPEFVIYRGEQAYPEYLITYKIVE